MEECWGGSGEREELGAVSGFGEDDFGVGGGDGGGNVGDVVGVEVGGGCAGGAVDGGVIARSGGCNAGELADGELEEAIDGATALDGPEADGVAFGDGVAVLAVGGGDFAAAGAAVEPVVGGGAALLGAVYQTAEVFLGAAEGMVVVDLGGGAVIALYLTG